MKNIWDETIISTNISTTLEHTSHQSSSSHPSNHTSSFAWGTTPADTNALSAIISLRSVFSARRSSLLYQNKTFFLPPALFAVSNCYNQIYLSFNRLKSRPTKTICFRYFHCVEVTTSAATIVVFAHLSHLTCKIFALSAPIDCSLRLPVWPGVCIALFQIMYRRNTNPPSRRVVASSPTSPNTHGWQRATPSCRFSGAHANAAAVANFNQIMHVTFITASSIPL